MLITHCTFYNILKISKYTTMGFVKLYHTMSDIYFIVTSRLLSRLIKLEKLKKAYIVVLKSMY